MKKNTASQFIGVQMITAADGTAFTGTVTNTYTIDGGTQTAGATVTHEGNGVYTMPVSATLSNGDHIIFGFIGTGAIPASVQVYTTFPQSVDNDVLASGATGFAAIDTVVDAIKVVTDKLVFTVANQVDSNVLSISGDGPAADNLELDYDGTGYAKANSTMGTVTANTDLVSAQSVADLILPKTNTAYPDIPFLMVDETDLKTPETGLTVTATRSIDGGTTFVATTGTVAEAASGIYHFDASAADMNGKIITFKFSATGAADTFVELTTSE